MIFKLPTALHVIHVHNAPAPMQSDKHHTTANLFHSARVQQAPKCQTHEEHDTYDARVQLVSITCEADVK